MMTHLSLFSGIGGLDLAAHWAGIRTVGQCEWADYPTKILEKHWPDVPRWRDIRTLTKESFYERTKLRTVDVVSGGFPCQPFSHAGQRRGKDDDRFLWPEMCRVVAGLGPRWVVGENVPGLLTMGIEACLSDLAGIGYRGRVFVLPADAVGADFAGERVFIVAASDSVRRDCLGKDQQIRSEELDSEMPFPWGSGQDHLPVDLDGFFTGPSRRVERNDDGLSEGMDRLKCVGNAVCPQQAFPIFAAIAEIERLTHA